MICQLVPIKSLACVIGNLRDLTVQSDGEGIHQAWAYRLSGSQAEPLSLVERVDGRSCCCGGSRFLKFQWYVQFDGGFGWGSVSGYSGIQRS